MDAYGVYLRGRGVLRMAKDYRGFQDQVMGDVKKAALQAVAITGEGGITGKKIRLRKSDLAGVVPPGSSVRLIPTVFHKLQSGDVICARVEKDIVVRRYVRYEMDGAEAILLVTHDNASLLEEITSAQLIGRVVEVEFKGKTWDPRAELTGLKAWLGKLTDYGTTNPLKKIWYSLLDLKRVLK